MNILERVYLFFYNKKKQKTLKTQKALPYPVISIGNLTVGGTGKTSFTVELSKILMKEGYFPVVLTRGYRGKIRKPHIVTVSDKPEDVGDEALMMAEEGLTVVKGIDRYEAGVYAIERLNLGKNTVFVLDDGFQHWSLKKDLNILLFDGYRGVGNSRLIPLGILRSPLSEISEADMIFITKKENEILSQNLKALSGKEIFFCPINILGFFNKNKDELIPESQKLFAFAGIGSFESFLDLLKKEDFKILGYKKFIDHKKYTEKTIRRIIRLAEGCDFIVTTKKDFVKIKRFKNTPPNIYYIDFSFQIPKRAIILILEKIKNLT
ncbi:MAG: tetraacyldisaccharide 4'-kinase [Thermodesulfovibrionaceae bacterium]